MKEIQTITFSLNELSQVASTLWALHPTCKIFTFTGHLGAGKTTLVKEMLLQAGVKEVITSPTFTYVNVYHHNKQTLYHFDLYRLKSLDEFLIQGFNEYLYLPDSWAFIEWPEIIDPLLERQVCHITIDYCGEDKRKLTYRIT